MIEQCTGGRDGPVDRADADERDVRHHGRALVRAAAGSGQAGQKRLRTGARPPDRSHEKRGGGGVRTAVALRLLDLWVMAHQPMTEAIRRELAAIGDEHEGPDPDEMLSPDDEAY